MVGVKYLEEEFTRELSYAEVNWFYIQIPLEQRHLFPKGNIKFKITFQGQTFDVSLTKANRIIKKEIIDKICESESFRVTIIKQNDGEFEIQATKQNIKSDVNIGRKK